MNLLNNSQIDTNTHKNIQHSPPSISFHPAIELVRSDVDFHNNFISIFNFKRQKKRNVVKRKSTIQTPTHTSYLYKYNMESIHKHRTHWSKLQILLKQ